MELILLDMNPAVMKAYCGQFGLVQAPDGPTNPQIYLQEGQPPFQNIQTNDILFLCFHHEHFLVMDQLTQVFSKEKRIKFVPLSTLQNMA
jgi:hypothetical protein